MQIRNNILAKQLRLGDTVVLAGESLRVYKVEPAGDDNVRVEFFGEAASRVSRNEAEVEIIIDLKAGQNYFVGNRDEDFEWLVCEYLHKHNEKAYVWLRSPLESSDNAIAEPYFRIVGPASNEAIAALYLKYRGTRCPFCRSDDISNGDHNTDDNWHSISVTCDCCGATWDDVYTLNNVNDLEPPDAFK